MSIPHTVLAVARLAYRQAMMRGRYDYQGNHMRAQVQRDYVHVWDLDNQWFVPIENSWL